MDLKLFGLLAIFLIAVLLPEAEGWWRRRRRIRVRIPWRPICRWACPRVCTYYTGRGMVCRFVCSKVCGRKKRGTEDKTNGRPGHLTPIPRNFDFYDLNDDGFITIDEIETTLGETKGNCEQMFKLADTNHDGKLSLDEFENGPLVFEKYPGDPDDDDDQGKDGNPGQGGDDGNTGQGGDNGNQGQGGDDGNQGQGGDNGKPGNQGNEPGQRSIEFDEE